MFAGKNGRGSALHGSGGHHVWPGNNHGRAQHGHTDCYVDKQYFCHVRPSRLQNFRIILPDNGKYMPVCKNDDNNG